MNATQLGERRFDRGAWLTLTAVLLFALVVFGSTYAVLAMPGDGWQMVYGQPPLTAFLGDWPTALQAGDVVLAVDGIPISVSALEPLQPLAVWQEGAIIPYTVERDGRVQTVEVQLGTLSRRQMLHAVGNSMRHDLPQWSWFFVALLVFALRPGSSAARLLLLAAGPLVLATKVGWAATTVGAGFAAPPVWYAQALTSTFWAWLFFPALILLMLSFPQRIWPLTRFPRLATGLIFLVPLGMTVVTFLFQWEAAGTATLMVEAALIFATAVVAVFTAFRNDGHREVRAQVSWLALGVALTIGGTLVFYLLDFAGLIDGEAFPDLLSWPLTLALPICLAIAILRYRLFDIDVIIRKTLLYAILTALLAVMYFGSVLLLQNVFGTVAGEQSPAVIVVSTLLIAALFAPLRRRVQKILDRRFFRNKYDAQQVLARFAETARDETDRVMLTAVLVGVIQETVQPERVTLWLNQNEKEA